MDENVRPRRAQRQRISELDFFPQEFQVDYDKSNMTLVIEYRLPALVDLPTLVEVRYIAAPNDFKETHLRDRDVNALYDKWFTR
jgi:hypothetical protein